MFYLLTYRTQDSAITREFSSLEETTKACQEVVEKTGLVPLIVPIDNWAFEGDLVITPKRRFNHG